MSQLRARMGALRAFAVAIALALAPQPGHAAGSIPVALSQQMDANGKPLVGALLYLYVVGTVAQPQLAYQDTGLSLPLPWPVVADANGRLPMFYLADGSIHARLTDAAGSVQFDYPSMLVIGPSGGGGGGSSVDPTTIFGTGDTKWRPTSETLSGWVKMNGLTIGSSLSGASGRANADTQALFIYLWTNCPDAHCPVLSGRGANALADFNANKQLTTLDLRGRSPFGLDGMGNVRANIIADARVTSGGGDTADTAAAFGGASTATLLQGNLPNVNFAVTLPTLSIPMEGKVINALPQAFTDQFFSTQGPAGGSVSFPLAVTVTGTGTAASGGSGTAVDKMDPFILGTWYMRL